MNKFGNRYYCVSYLAYTDPKCFCCNVG